MLKLINNKVWLYFVKNPSSSIHIRELARKLNLSPPNILNQVRQLLKENLLKSKKQGKNLIITSNYENDEFIEKKKWTNLFLLIDSQLIDEIKEKVDTIILFGSFCRGEDTEKSDIDIAIDKEIDIDKIEKYEDILNRKIQFHIIDKNISNNLKENIKQGALIKGVMI